MLGPMYFVQECPTCGRRLQIRVEYLGRQVVCQHCRGKLTARDPESHRYPDNNDAEDILRRAEELLQESARHMSYSRVGQPR